VERDDLLALEMAKTEGTRTVFRGGRGQLHGSGEGVLAVERGKIFSRGKRSETGKRTQCDFLEEGKRFIKSLLRGKRKRPERKKYPGDLLQAI